MSESASAGKLVLEVLTIVSRYSNFGSVSDGSGSLPATSLLAVEHVRRVMGAIQANRSIAFVLPAFPAKSPNSEKTIGPLPDLGELLALRRLQRVCSEISRIHPAGAAVIICSDGRVFSDLVSVDDGQVTEYGQAIERMIAREGLDRLRVFGLEDAFATRDPSEMRRALLANYAATPGEVQRKVRECTSTKRLFNGMHRFLFEDGFALHPHLSKERVRQEAKELTYELIRRSDAWSRLVGEIFADAVRLSIHPQNPGSSKLGIRLLPSDDSWRTPWHSAVLVEGARARLVRRREAEALGARIESYRGEYPFYAIGPGAEEVIHAFV